jgi:glycosyltransferase involved in cell wall biosynthesis
MPDLRVLYCCHFGQPSGYSRAAHDYLMALRDANVEFVIWPLAGVDSWDPDELHPCYHELERHLCGAPDWLPTHMIVHAMPHEAIRFVEQLSETGMPENVRKVCVTTWETSRISFLLAKHLGETFDLIIVPSKHSRGAIGVRAHPDDIVVVPHAISKDYWLAPKDWMHASCLPYTFYSIGVWGDRKNLEGLLRAYLTCFSGEDEVVLKIIAPEVDRNAIDAIASAGKLTHPPRVHYITERLSLDQLRAIHHQSHCYVSASRGEGWGLGAFEAAATGHPVIVPKWGGSIDFLINVVEGWYRLIPGTLTPALPMNQEMGQTLKVGGQFFRTRQVRSIAPEGVNGYQKWFEPDLEFLQEEMIAAYRKRVGQDPDYPHFTPADVRKTQGIFAHHFGYESVGRKFRRALEAL